MYNELKDDIKSITYPVCPSRAAWCKAPLPLLSFWFILAPFCSRNSQAGNDPLRKKKTHLINYAGDYPKLGIELLPSRDGFHKFVGSIL